MFLAIVSVRERSSGCGCRDSLTNIDEECVEHRSGRVDGQLHSLLNVMLVPMMRQQHTACVLHAHPRICGQTVSLHGVGHVVVERGQPNLSLAVCSHFHGRRGHHGHGGGDHGSGCRLEALGVEHVPRHGGHIVGLVVHHRLLWRLLLSLIRHTSAHPLVGRVCGGLRGLVRVGVGVAGRVRGRKRRVVAVRAVVNVGGAWLLRLV